MGENKKKTILESRNQDCPTPAMRFAIECKQLLRSKQRGAPAG